MIELKIYVPAPGSLIASAIQPGSGIVGSPSERYPDDTFCVDYEGAIHGQRMTWEDKVFHAAGRHVKQYPTVARAIVNKEQMIEVGTFTCTDNWKNVTYAITNSEALEAWKAGK